MTRKGARYTSNTDLENVPVFKGSDSLNLDFRPDLVSSGGYESINHVQGKRYSNRNLMIEEEFRGLDSSIERKDVELAFKDSEYYVSGGSRNKYASSYYGGIRSSGHGSYYWG